MTGHRQLVAGMLICIAPLLALRAFGEDLRNGATWYRRAIEKVEAIDARQWEAFWAWERSGPPSTEVRAFLRNMYPMVIEFQRGSECAYVDFDLDYSRGFDLLMPHLARMRSAAKIIEADGTALLLEGNTSEAARRVAMLYRAGQQLSQDRVLISSLVGAAIFDLSDRLAQRMIDHGALLEHDASVMFRGLAHYDPRDPFGMVNGVAMEQEIAVEWLIDNFSTREQRSRAIEEDHWMFFQKDETTRDLFASITDAEFEAQIEEYDLVMDDVVEAFTLEDEDESREQLMAIEEDITSGEPGLLSSFIAPPLLTLLDHRAKVRERVESRRALLEQLAEGELSIEQEANAAILYLEAASRVRSIDENMEQDERDRVMADVTDMTIKASKRRRCDFEFVWRGMRWEFLPDYVVAVSRLRQVMLARIDEHIERDEHELVIESLAALIRMSEHCSHDRALLMCAVAQQIFEDAVERVRVLSGDDSFSEAAHETIVPALRAMSRDDPFGYIDAVAGMRKWSSSIVAGFMPPVTMTTTRPAQETYHDLPDASADEIVMLCALSTEYAKVQSPAKEDGGQSDAANEPALLGVLVDDWHTRVIESLPMVVAALAGGDPDAIDELDLPRISDLNERRTRARRAIREALIDLRADEPTNRSERSLDRTERDVQISDESSSD